MPASMNAPTPISTVLMRISEFSKHQSCQYKIEPQHRQRRVHYRTGRCLTDPFRGRDTIVSLKYRYPGDHHTKTNGLDDAIDHIIVKKIGRASCRERV